MQANNPNSILGVDLNEFNQNVNIPVLARRFGFIYLRAASYGTGKLRVDRRFAELARQCRTNNVPVGGYVYALPSQDLTTADTQCDGFIDTLQTGFGTGDYGDLFPVLDVEAPLDNVIPTTALVNWIERFKKRFESKTRRKLMLYTGEFFVDLYGNFFVPGRGFPLSTMPLWIAKYKELNPESPIPRNVGGWTRWRIWQYSEKGSAPGVASPVDLNYGPDDIDLLMPPAVVKNFRATRDANNIYVSWTPNTEIDLDGYNLFINRNYVTTLSGRASSYTIPLRNFKFVQQPYVVAIEAFDKDGDVSKTRAAATLPTFREDEVRSYDDSSIYLRYPENLTLMDYKETGNEE